MALKQYQNSLPSLSIFIGIILGSFSSQAHKVCVDALQSVQVPRTDGAHYVGDILSEPILETVPDQKQKEMIQASNFIRQLLGKAHLRVAHNADGSIRHNRGVPVVIGVREEGPVIIGVNDTGTVDFFGTFGAEIYTRALEASMFSMDNHRFSVRVIPPLMAEKEKTLFLIFVWDEKEKKVLFVATPPGNEENHFRTLEFAHQILEFGIPAEYAYE